MRARGLLLRELDEAEAALRTPHSMLNCPFLTSGTCVSGCWSEPRCITDEPIGGWESDVKESARSVADWCRDIADEATGRHGIVKHARDILRQAEKAAR